MSEAVSLKSGDFVRVRPDHKHPFRAGKDGMVVEDLNSQVALTFYLDRHSRDQGCYCVGPELWEKSELDMATLSR